MSSWSNAKRVIFGRPIATKHAHTERLPKRTALAVFASDALSSVAYATEEIMIQLQKFGGAPYALALFALTKDIALAISVLIAVVAISYYQTIHAYPQGGGSYTVSRENLGHFPGEVAGAALLIDYVLTVAVSVSAGVLAIVSMAPILQDHIVLLGLAAIGILTIANLRGTRESGLLFSLPTYMFVLLMAVMIVVAFFAPAVPAPAELEESRARLHAAVEANQSPLTILLILKAFSSGCTALTGIEAVSNGTQAFREPVARNASTVLLVMAGILAFLFLGTSFAAEKFHATPMEIGDPGFMTVTAQIASSVFGQGWYFYALQVFTAGILILAANTAYADFPRLASLIARDGYLPRQMASIGDRLVFHNGILALAGIAGLLIIAFQGDTHKLIPLYAIGVFLSFTLSQFGMVVHAYRHGRRLVSMVISSAGGVTTMVVMCVVLYSKFWDGAFLVPPALLLGLFVFSRIRRHYTYLAKEMEVDYARDVPPAIRTTTLLLVPRIHKGMLQAIAYAKTLSPDCRALHVTLDPKSTGRIKEEWAKFGQNMPLVILESPYRSLIQPITEYIDQAIEEDPDSVITVIVPQAIPRRWYHALLHDNVAVYLKLALGARKNVVITNVRYFLS
jgi:amino acid transporter